MALTLDSVLKAQDSPVLGAANPHRTPEGQGEAFSETLKLVRTTPSDSDTAVPPEPELSSGMTQLLPVETEAEVLPGAMETETPQASGDAPPTVSLDTSDAFGTATVPEETPTETGPSELETDRQRALSHEEAVQAAPPPLVAVPPVVTPTLAADAGPEMSQTSVPAINARVSANYPEDTALEAAIETVEMVAAATAGVQKVGVQKEEVTDHTARIDVQGVEISSKAAVPTDGSKLRDTQSADTAAAAPATASDSNTAKADAVLTAPIVNANGQDSRSAGDLSSPTAPAAPMAVSGHTPIQTGMLATPIPAALTPTHAMLVASPAQVVDIVSSAANDGQSDRIVVQLDPPELGRVSIDFKFDTNGLQHVTVTGESPEAVRQLRLMHFELTQALERHGITSQNMSFQQQHQNSQNTPLPYASTRQPLFGGPEDVAAAETLITANSLPSPRTLPGGRLDMKL